MINNYILSGFNKFEYINVETKYDRKEFTKALNKGKVKFHNISLKGRKFYGNTFRKSEEQARMTLNILKKFEVLAKEEYNDGEFKITLYAPIPVFKRITDISIKYRQHKNIELMELAKVATEEGQDYEVNPEEVPVYEIKEGEYHTIVAGRDNVVFIERTLMQGSGFWIRDDGNEELMPTDLW